MDFPAQEPRSLLSRSQEQPEGSRAWTQEGHLPRGQRVGRTCVGGVGTGMRTSVSFPSREASFFSHPVSSWRACAWLHGVSSCRELKTVRGWCLLVEVILLLPLMRGLHVPENSDPRKPQVLPSWCGPPSFLTWTLLP